LHSVLVEKSLHSKEKCQTWVLHRGMTIYIPAAPARADALPRPLERLEAEMVELAGQIAGATARFIALVGEFDRAEGWRDWGMRSTAHWLAWKCGLGLVAGREHVRVARALRQLPRIADEFAAGRLSFSKVRALTRLATPDTEAELIHVARNATAAQLDRLLAQHRRGARTTRTRTRRPSGWTTTSTTKASSSARSVSRPNARPWSATAST